MKQLKVPSSQKLLFAGILLGLIAAFASPAGAAPKKVLVVTTTEGFVHSSIPVAERVLGELAQKSGLFTVEYARVHESDPQFKGPDGKTDKAKVHEANVRVLAEKMNPQALKKYDLVIFASTTHDLPLPDKQAFLDWIKSGKGFMAIHAGADTFHNYPPYIEMLGGEFKTHGAQVSVDAINQDPSFPACRPLPPVWQVFDEIYQFQNFDRAKIHGLLTMDKHPNDKTPGDYPISWCRLYGETIQPPANGAALLMQRYWPKKAGRVFYTSLGHREDLWDPNWPDRKNSPEVARQYQAHILGAIKWALWLREWKCRTATDFRPCHGQKLNDALVIRLTIDSMNENESSSAGFNRRDFLRGGSLATVMTMLGGVELFSPASAAFADDEKKSTAKTKVAVIGLGAWGREILNTLGTLDKAQVAAICDTYPAALKRSSAAAPGAAQDGDFQAVLDNKDIPCVIIATPSPTHKDLALAALKAGKHVYCEAPLANTVEDAREIALAAKAAKRQIFQAGLQIRSDAERLFLLPFIRSGALGKMVMARSQWHKKTSWRSTSPNPEREKAINWRLDKATSLGLAGEIGIHQFDQAAWFINALPTAVTAWGSIQLWSDGRDVADTIQAVLEFPGGVR